MTKSAPRPPAGQLAKSEEARQLQDSLKANAAAISDELIRIAALIGPTQKLASAEGQTAFAEALSEWERPTSTRSSPNLPP